MLAAHPLPEQADALDHFHAAHVIVDDPPASDAGLSDDHDYVKHTE